MALSNKSNIKNKLQHAMMLPDEVKSAVETVFVAADSTDEDSLEKMQEILQLIVDSNYEEPDLL